jgi:hypothetical protein
MSENSSNALDDKIEALTDQVGRLAEGLINFRLEMQRGTTELRAYLAAREAAIERQNEISMRQVETTDRLVRIVETLIQQ